LCIAGGGIFWREGPSLVPRQNWVRRERRRGAEGAKEASVGIVVGIILDIDCYLFALSLALVQYYLYKGSNGSLTLPSVDGPLHLTSMIDLFNILCSVDDILVK